MTSTNSLTADDLGSAAQRDRRKRILDATIALASKGGFDAVQMRAVAEQADVALGTLYRYFPSKIHLLVSALGREFEKAEAADARQADPRRHPARAGDVRPRPHHPRPPGRPAPDRGAHPRVHVRRRLGAERDPPRRHAADLDADPGHAPGQAEELTDEDIAIAQVIGDVWLSALVGWVTGRTTAEDVDPADGRRVRSCCAGSTAGFEQASASTRRRRFATAERSAAEGVGGGDAAVDGDLGAGDVGALVAGQEDVEPARRRRACRPGAAGSCWRRTPSPRRRRARGSSRCRSCPGARS